MANKEKSQIDKFREVAREHETDDSEEAFDRVLKRVAVAPPKDKREARREKDKPTSDE